MTQQRLEHQGTDAHIAKVDQSICPACGSLFRSKEDLREHQLYCSDPAFCLCHVDRAIFTTRGS